MANRQDVRAGGRSFRFLYMKLVTGAQWAVGVSGCCVLSRVWSVDVQLHTKCLRRSHYIIITWWYELYPLLRGCCVSIHVRVAMWIMALCATVSGRCFHLSVHEWFLCFLTKLVFAVLPNEIRFCFCVT